MIPRSAALGRLGAETFDLLVIGGGINGAGIARDAAMRGLATALVEHADFASGTSSRSSKLIHGGFRYLEHGEVRLVLEGVRERGRLRRLAPHLVQPQEFVFPVYAGAPVGLLKLAAGLWAYDLLAGLRNVQRHRMLSARATRAAEPALRTAGLRGAGRYWDCRTDDARLVLETILAAVDAGAVAISYARVTAFVKEAGRIIGDQLVATLRQLTLELYAFGAAHAEAHGIILADTKFEFGLVGDGSMILIDEVMTPDSSRYWPKDLYQPGGPQPSFDKQFVRDYLEEIRWNKQPPVPSLPDQVVERTREKYIEAFRRLSGRELV